MNSHAQVLLTKSSMERFSLRTRRSWKQTGLGKLLADSSQVLFILHTRIVYLLQLLNEWLVCALFSGEIVVVWHGLLSFLMVVKSPQSGQDTRMMFPYSR